MQQATEPIHFKFDIKPDQLGPEMSISSVLACGSTSSLGMTLCTIALAKSYLPVPLAGLAVFLRLLHLARPLSLRVVGLDERVTVGRGVEARGLHIHQIAQVCVACHTGVIHCRHLECLSNCH